MSKHSGRGWNWRAFRQAAKRHFNWKCSECGHAGRLEVHHIVPVANGGAMFDMANIEVLCRKCHFARHRLLDPLRQEWQRMIAEL